jgi:hypothetical protein
VTLYSAALGVAIAQACYATGANHERALLQKLLGELDLEGVLIQADALHTQQAFFGSSQSRGPTRAAQKSVLVGLGGPVTIGFRQRVSPLPMPETVSAAVDLGAPDDLISFLKAIPDGRYRRGVRYPQWFLLLVAVLGILSGCRSSRDLEAFAKRHREALNQALGLNFKRWPSDATFLYLFNKAHLQEFGEVLQAWMISQIPGGAEGLDQLVCDGKTLRGSAIETEDGNHRFV